MSTPTATVNPVVKQLLLIGLLSLTSMSAIAETDYSDQPYFVKVWLSPVKAVVGQRVLLNIMVGTDSYFTGGTQFTLPKLEHALMLESEPTAYGNETLNGKYFTTILRQIDIYPDQQEILQIPSFNVSFSQPVTSDGEFKTATVQLSTDPLLGLVRALPEMAGLNGYMVSNDVAITDDWSGLKDTEYSEGDVFQRKIVVKAAGMASMNMPQINPHVPRGVSVVLAEPVLSSQSNREAQSATMTQRISYAIEKPGQYELGGEMLSWWDPKTAKRVDHRFESEIIYAGGMSWRLESAVAILILIIVLLAWRINRFLKNRDQTERLIKKKLHSADAGDRLASLYAYADHHQTRSSAPAQLRVLMSAASQIIESSLSGRYSSSPVSGQPSHAESRSLYRQLKKIYKRSTR